MSGIACLGIIPLASTASAQVPVVPVPVVPVTPVPVAPVVEIHVAVDTQYSDTLDKVADLRAQVDDMVGRATGALRTRLRDVRAHVVALERDARSIVNDKGEFVRENLDSSLESATDLTGSLQRTLTTLEGQARADVETLRVKTARITAQLSAMAQDATAPALEKEILAGVDAAIVHASALRVRIDEALAQAAGPARISLQDVRTRAVSLEQDLRAIQTGKAGIVGDRLNDVRIRAADLVNRLKAATVVLQGQPLVDVNRLIESATGIYDEAQALAQARAVPAVELSEVEAAAARERVARLSGHVAGLGEHVEAALEKTTGAVRERLQDSRLLVGNVQEDMRGILNEKGEFVREGIDDVRERLSLVKGRVVEAVRGLAEGPRVEVTGLIREIDLIDRELRAMKEIRAATRPTVVPR